MSCSNAMKMHEAFSIAIAGLVAAAVAAHVLPTPWLYAVCSWAFSDGPRATDATWISAGLDATYAAVVLSCPLIFAYSAVVRSVYVRLSPIGVLASLFLAARDCLLAMIAAGIAALFTGLSFALSPIAGTLVLLSIIAIAIGRAIHNLRQRNWDWFPS